jgi:hypothetical protein
MAESQQLIARSKSVGDLIVPREEEASPAQSRCMSVDEAIASPTEEPPAVTLPRSGSLFEHWMAFKDTSDDCDLRLLPTDDSSSSGDSSVGYFDPADFITTNWESTVDIIPPVGFAVMASGFALLHPVLFVAGALTAFGAVGAIHAMRETYVFCFDGALCNVVAEDEEKKPKKNDDDMDPLSEVTYTLTEEDSGQVMHQLMNLNDLTDNACAPAVQEKFSVHRSDPSRLETKEALKWVDHHYPSLEFTAVDKIEFVGLNALEFFNVFFANDAPYTFEEFQKKRQDKDIEYGLWEDLHRVQQPSLHQKALSCTDLSLSFQERILNFKAKTNNYFGPAYATTCKVQRALVASKHLLVLESKTRISDVPFSDRFHLMERWVVTADKQQDRYVSSLSICTQVFFTSGCPFQSKIKSATKDTYFEIAKTWCIMAQEALILTEEHRFKRLRSESLINSDDNDPPAKSVHPEDASVEVERLGYRKSYVAGEEEKEHGRETVERETIEAPNVSGNRSRATSIGKMGRSLSKYVRKRHSKSEDARLDHSISSHVVL